MPSSSRPISARSPSVESLGVRHNSAALSRPLSARSSSAEQRSVPPRVNLFERSGDKKSGAALTRNSACHRGAASPAVPASQLSCLEREQRSVRYASFIVAPLGRSWRAAAGAQASALHRDGWGNHRLDGRVGRQCWRLPGAEYDCQLSDCTSSESAVACAPSWHDHCSVSPALQSRVQVPGGCLRAKLPQIKGFEVCTATQPSASMPELGG
jgi:hypothetical protein